MNTDIYKNLVQDIDDSLEGLKNGIEWTNTYLKAERKINSYKKMVNIRREYKKIRYALQQNPSAALYGVSQVGKSYLANIMLSKPGNNFIVKDYKNNIEYDYLEQINPKGGGTEATAVVTRFSTNIQIPNEDFPVMIKIMRPKDIAIMLIDSALSEVRKGLEVLSELEIKDVIEQLQGKKNTSSPQNFFSEDDILDIRDYIKQYFSDSKVYLRLIDTSFWEMAAATIEYLKSDTWVDLLSIIWGQNEYISNVFSKLIKTIENTGYADYVYCKFETVLRENGTLLDVARLHEFNKPQTSSIVFCPNTNTTTNIPKSYLCAIAAEVGFKLEKEIEETKPFLKHIDLLDFPGARSREEYHIDKLDDNIQHLILRGKVSYLFNHYSDSYLINNLLFCNNSSQLEVTHIPELLNTWISRFIGKTPEEREEFLKDTKTDPLFIIYTWYNTDLAYNFTNFKKAEDLPSKWESRFVKIFEQQIVGKNFKWHKEWQSSQSFFKNNYMLRDLRLSQEINHLFKGYRETGKETELDKESYATSYPNYWEDLEQSFVNYPFVKQHFDNPQLMWDESSTPNNDGSLPILRNLALSAEDSNARINKFIRSLQALKAQMQQEMANHYHDDSADKKIEIAAAKAGQIQSDLDITFGRDPYFFGHFISRFLVKESEIYNYYHSKMNDIELVEGKNFPEYAAIRYALKGLSSRKEDYDKNIALLMNTYKFRSEEEMQAYYKEKNIDLEELFYGETTRMKSSSEMLAEGLVSKWLDDNLTEENLRIFVEQGHISSNAVIDLIDNIKLQFERLGITKLIGQNIRRYVDRYDKIDKIQEMIADTSAAIINNFVNTMGYAYYSEEEKALVEKTNKENNLGINTNHSYLEFEEMQEDELTNLFETMKDLDVHLNKAQIDREKVKNAPSFSHFVKWKDMMHISFISSCDIPTYDIEANAKLGKVIDEMSTYDYKV